MHFRLKKEGVLATEDDFKRLGKPEEIITVEAKKVSARHRLDFLSKKAVVRDVSEKMVENHAARKHRQEFLKQLAAKNEGETQS